MILQLSNGKVIEISTDQYLDLTDLELHELNYLSIGYTRDCSSSISDKHQEYEDEEGNLFDDDEPEGHYYLPNDEIF